ncbi:MAG: FecR domain-containing protein [Lachnospiraceae bacterium]|nr:FecR domain-containing protein [Lachnospiraceae bacterium]
MSRFSKQSSVLPTLFVICLSFVLGGCGIKATTVRLLKYQGEVSLENNNTSKSVKEDLRLSSGDLLSTSTDSQAYIGLDDYKLVTLDEESKASFNQEGKNLSLDLEKGSVFFNVTKSLDEDESFNIRTSTLVTGIRGTSGLVSIDDNGYTSIYLTDGHVSLECKNPKTEEVKYIDLDPGMKLTVYTYDDRDTDSVEYVYDRFYGPDLPEFARDIISNDSELLDKVLSSTGWDDMGSAPQDVREFSSISEALRAYFNDNDSESLLKLALSDDFKDKVSSEAPMNDEDYYGFFLDGNFLGEDIYYFSEDPEFPKAGDLIVYFVECKNINENSRVFVIYNSDNDTSGLGVSWETGSYYADRSDKYIAINAFTGELLTYYDGSDSGPATSEIPLGLY